MTPSGAVRIALHLAQQVPPPAPVIGGWSWSMLPTLIAVVGTTVGAARMLELYATRKSRRGQDSKVQVDAASVISGELRQWTVEANARAKAAEERASQIETRLQLRIDELVEKLNKAEATADRAEEALQRADLSMRRLEERIMACQAGPVCPVRTADTNPRMLAVTPKQP